MGDEVSQKSPYDHNIPQSEKGRIQNRLNKRRSRKRLKLKLAAAASLGEEPELNSHKHITLEPTNTYQLRGRNVVPKCGQPPLSQKGDRESTIVTCGRSVDKARMESTSEEGITIMYPSDAVRGSRRPDYPSQVQTERQNDCLGAQSLHTTSDTQKSDINIVRPVLKAPQQCRTPSDKQESGQPMLTPTASDRTVDVARGALDHLLSISPEVQSEGDSQSLCCIPARPQLHTHVPGSTQDLNATLAQFRTHFQQVLNSFKLL